MRRPYRALGHRLAGRCPELGALFGAAELRQRFATFNLEEMMAELRGTAYAAASI